MISKGAIKRAKILYEKRWGKTWPHDDEYLTTLVKEAKRTLGLAANARHRYDEVYEETLVLMRLDHHWEDAI